MNFQKLLRDLEQAPDDVADEYVAGIVNQVSEWAAANGHAALVREWTPAATRLEARRYLAEAIAATKTAPNDELLTLDQAADILGYSASGLRKIITQTKAGKPGIQFSQIGNGPIKFKREWLDEFAVANSTMPRQPRPRVEPQHLKPPR
ncbi:MAG: hypothetical protein KF688_18095 [Pirellulales bacterium]|nr:hypothetical protein [Pirellulales bacterium]